MVIHRFYSIVHIIKLDVTTVVKMISFCEILVNDWPVNVMRICPSRRELKLCAATVMSGEKKGKHVHWDGALSQNSMILSFGGVFSTKKY